MDEPFNQPAVAGGSIKPRVERSGTLGVISQKPPKPVKQATEVERDALPPAPRAP